MSDLEMLNSDMHEAFDDIIDETLTDPVTGLDVVVDGFDGPATIRLVVPLDFDHPEAEDIEEIDEETKRVRGGEDLWGPLVTAAHELSHAADPDLVLTEDVDLDEAVEVDVDDAEDVDGDEDLDDDR
ncbi:hypothetical protein [Georgenia sp. SYP-B2076]|uniref:hypothetical protein n=1 Tax=Georgenia sp. SYP-B2076 TaxID=2495881 RepID=UPI000F8F7461|nr:hypothetical protein [Georgenia sp. SYP-B2076]